MGGDYVVEEREANVSKCSLLVPERACWRSAPVGSVKACWSATMPWPNKLQKEGRKKTHKLQKEGRTKNEDTHKHAKRRTQNNERKNDHDGQNNERKNDHDVLESRGKRLHLQQLFRDVDLKAGVPLLVVGY